jgi:putative flavoprotein involved in K+ transport
MIAVEVDEQFAKWLGLFNAAAAAADVDALLILFQPDAFWRDALAFTWNLRTAEGHDEIRQMLDACLARTAPTAWRQTRPARLEDGIVEGIAEFETQAARCKAVIRLREGKVWTLLTSMTELKGFEEAPGERLDHASSSHGGGAHWEQRSDVSASTEQPHCLIVGAGHCGLGLGAQLQTGRADVDHRSPRATVRYLARSSRFCWRCTLPHTSIRCRASPFPIIGRCVPRKVASPTGSMLISR